MKKIYLLLMILPLLCVQVMADELTTVSDGNWSDEETWGEDSPGNGDEMIIGHAVTMDDDITNNSTITIESNGSLTGPTFNLRVKPGETLIVRGYLEVNDLTFDNGSHIIFEEGAVIVVRGDLTNKNNSDDVTLDGDITVFGDLDNGMGGVIDGDGQIDVRGSFLGEGSTFGWSPTSTIEEGTIASRATLPVELIDFSINKDNSDAILLWSTATEINNDFLEIQRSINGLEFEVLSIVKGAGNSNSKLDYSYTDNNIPVGTMYYRLKQVDYDGEFEYSEIIALASLKDNSECVLNVNPNPCIGKCYVNFESCDNEDNNAVTFSVFDMTGNVVFSSMPKTVKSGKAAFSFEPENHLKPAVYVIRGSGTTEQIDDKKVIIQK